MFVLWRKIKQKPGIYLLQKYYDKEVKFYHCCASI